MTDLGALMARNGAFACRKGVVRASQKICRYTTFASWSAEFDCADDKAQELKQFIGETVFQEGLNALETALAYKKAVTQPI